MSKSHMPPAPPAARSPKGSGDPHKAPQNDGGPKKALPENLDEQARQGNVGQNTHHQGYQQDR